MIPGGLGVERQGRLEPVATSLKLDRRGLGHGGVPRPPSGTPGEKEWAPGVKEWAPGERAESPDGAGSGGEREPSAGFWGYGGDFRGGGGGPRRVTHFASHRPAEEAEGGVSTAKQAQDSLGKGGAKGARGGGGGRKRNRNRRSLDERLEKKRVDAIRSEVYSNVPEGYEGYFATGT